ncbi:hypothetical protein CFELI_06035 [Corynebacterium felinum]|uniref:Uncharacterized protein n=1 Tax=Corynebacterium felinum TaxID=131318 RepID=A0ABU2BA60_9CORY|nr:hypothetical protein [Corynebacterium felinum]WJY94829.1 hypothetical protein CFELI_06035 [Corynebacterium felinum]
MIRADTRCPRSVHIRDVYAVSYCSAPECLGVAFRVSGLILGQIVRRDLHGCHEKRLHQ